MISVCDHLLGEGVVVGGWHKADDDVVPVVISVCDYLGGGGGGHKADDDGVPIVVISVCACPGVVLQQYTRS